MKIGVIGGSLAGLEFTKTVKKLDSSIQVKVFEEDKEIGKPVKCAEGWVDVHGAGKPCKNSIENKIDKLTLNFRKVPQSLKKVSLKAKGDVFVIDRTKNEKYLAEKCMDLGAEIEKKERKQISDLKPNFDLVVDASGCPSQYWREIGKERKQWSRGIQYQVKGDFSKYINELFFEFSTDTLGYYWIFPKSKRIANIGVGWSLQKGPLNPWKALKSFCEEKIENSTIKKKTAGMIGNDMYTPFFKKEEKVAVIGDAAGLADPCNGEGMASAVVSARLLAKSIHKNSLTSFNQKTLEILGPQLRNSLLLRKIWDSLKFKDFAEIFNSLNGVPLKTFFEKPGEIRKKIFRKLVSNPLLMVKTLPPFFSYKTSLI